MNCPVKIIHQTKKFSHYSLVYCNRVESKFSWNNRIRDLFNIKMRMNSNMITIEYAMLAWPYDFMMFTDTCAAWMCLCLCAREKERKFIQIVHKCVFTLEKSNLIMSSSIMNHSWTKRDCVNTFDVCEFFSWRAFFLRSVRFGLLWILVRCACNMRLIIIHFAEQIINITGVDAATNVCSLSVCV